MPEKDKTYRIFISAAEPSADAHCAGLITALKQSSYNIEFTGVGGPKMAQAGCKLLETTVSRASMAYAAFTQVIHFCRLINRISRFLKTEKVDLVIVCDSPAFNFHVAKAAKKREIKTLFYVAPQLWAWGGWRIGKLKKYCDRLCCILPFEQDWFKSRGVEATFVGNPLLDELGANSGRQRKSYADFEPDKVKLALIPGSRAAEIDSLWQPMQQIALRLKRKYPNLSVTAAAVDDERKELLRSRQLVGFRCRYIIDAVNEAARDADFAIVASGSATLEAAAAGCPMVIIYQSSRILWHLLGKWLLKTKYLSLVNILAERDLVPEFMPYFSSIDPIVNTVEQLLKNKNKLTQTSSELAELTGSLRNGNASAKVAQIVTEMLAEAIC